jgi:RNA polymerase sigma factor (sigma-70 family)
MPLGPSSSSPGGTSLAAQLSDPQLHRVLSSMVRRKIPGPDAEDLVQSTLADALAAPRVPEDPTELRRWVFGIARNKIADYYRIGRREVPHEPPALDAPVEGSQASAAEPHSARDLLRWAEEALPENSAAQQTFDWMLREGEGEKLESIAAEAKLPAPQVRKRVSRLRQHLKRKWVMELAAVAALGIIVLVGLRLLRHSPGIDVGPDRSAQPVQPTDAERAAELRRAALEACGARDFRLCIEKLDQAAALDAAGDVSDEVPAAREVARQALQPPESLPAGTGAPSEPPSKSGPWPDDTVHAPPVLPGKAGKGRGLFSPPATPSSSFAPTRKPNPKGEEGKLGNPRTDGKLGNPRTDGKLGYSSDSKEGNGVPRSSELELHQSSHATMPAPAQQAQQNAAAQRNASVEQNASAPKKIGGAKPAPAPRAVNNAASNSSLGDSDTAPAPATKGAPRNAAEDINLGSIRTKGGKK